MKILKKEYELRCESDIEAKEIIEKYTKEEEAKNNTIAASSITYKEKKQKGEVIDSAFIVKIKVQVGTVWE